LSQSFDFPILNHAAIQFKPSYSKANVFSLNAEPLLNPIRLPDAHEVAELDAAIGV
jgi:hypothetical protein